MLLEVLVIFLGTVLLWVYLKWTRVRSYWAVRRVPHLPPHFVFGSLLFINKKNAGIWMREMYERFNTSPYYGIWLFWRPSLVINCPTIARSVLVKDFEVFRNRFLTSGKSDPIGGLNIFTVDDPLWSYMRKRLSPLFTISKLKIVHGLVTKKCSELMKRIQMDIDLGETVDLRSMYSDYTTDIIGITSFGISSEATLKGESHMRKVTKDFMEFSIMRGFAWISIFFLPDVVDVMRFSLFPKKTTDFFKKVYKAVVSQRSKTESKDKDILDALLKIKEEADKNNEEITEDMLIAQAAVFIQGGFDTSACTLTFATYELAFHQEAQEKLYNEILEYKQKLGEEEFNLDVLASMPYLNAVINEALRKYPPMGFLDRRALRDYKIDDHLTIEAGTPIYVNAIGMHYDPKYFPDPYGFHPERFLPENEKNIVPFTFMPFGEGPRHCIGKRFSMISVRSALANVFLNYRVQPLPGAPKPNDCEIERHGIFYMPEAKMSVEFVPRNNAIET